ncbi:formyltransferase family protein [Blattabacterium cuenoti]|uniref:formyltransferase family protein n=1 Tax=Blattabacterium cuenoti TaxID=1653831 RepID=UPI00163C15E8|nr:formyltransferase family protein [Blattabacterium cuenoti]
MKKISILVSGMGTNMKHILQAINNKVLTNITVNSIISDRYCPAIKYALKNNMKAFSLEKINKKFLSLEINNLLMKDPPNLIILSGFLFILNKEFCEKWHRKIINIHPSLLPKYGGKGMYGMKVHEKVINNKEKISGATVHYVTKDVDLGSIILKKSCSISSKETPISLSKKISFIEKEILIKSIINLLN